MDFISKFDISANSCVSVVGSGGKSSLIKRLAVEASQKGWPTIITTTTHIHLPFFSNSENLFLSESEDINQSAVNFFLPTSSEKNPLVLVKNKVSPIKASGFSANNFDSLLGKFLLLIEADGSKGKPFKVPNKTEPVIPAGTTHSIIVVGLSSLGKPLDEKNVHRFELLDKNYKEKFVTPSLVAKVVCDRQNYIDKIPHGSKVFCYLSGCDDEIELDYAKSIVLEIEKSGILMSVYAGDIIKNNFYVLSKKL